jgi:hypothetical protein
VYAAVGILQEELNGLGGELHATIAGCAMDLYRRTFHRWPWRTLGPETNELARGAFYGGRAEAFVLGQVEGVNLYDTNSLYPYVQDTARFPLPNRLRLDTSIHDLDDLKGAEGAAAAVLTAPEVDLPLLPYRVDGRLFFPTGELRGVWTLGELREARERGVEIQEIVWALSSTVTFNPFHEFIEALWSRRQGYLAADDGRAAVVKLLMNSLYGRFGLNPEGGLWRLFPAELDPGDGRFRGFVTSEIAGQPVMAGPVLSTRIPAYVNVLIAAQVAAEARLHLFRTLEGQSDDLIYCDTDSVLTRGVLEESDGLGGWRVQMRSGSADLIGPKEYLLHNQVGGTLAVAKGVPESEAETYIRAGAVRYRRALRVREALSQGKDPAEWVEVLKERRSTLPKRCPVPPFVDDPTAFTLTVPWSAQQLAILSGRTPPGPYRPPHGIGRPRLTGWADYMLRSAAAA